MVKVYDGRLGESKDHALELYEQEGTGILCSCGEAWHCHGQSGDWQRDADGNWYHWHGGFPGRWHMVGRQ
jgi:hypothetical protein